MELDDKNIKGYLLCGQILCEQGKTEPGYSKIESGIRKLTKGANIYCFPIYFTTRTDLTLHIQSGLTLCSGQVPLKKQFEKEISQVIFRAKKLLWYKKYAE